MKSDKKRIMVLAIFVLLIFFVFFLSTNTNTSHLLGFTIYDSQPDSESGKDSYMRSGAGGDTNYGTSTVLRVGKTAGEIEFRSTLEFDLSSILASNTITSSQLQIYLSTSYSSNNITLSLYRLTSPWTESEIGWNNRTATNTWSTAGGDYSELFASISVNETGYYNFSLTNLVKGWINTTYPNYGLIIVSEDAGLGDYKEFSSSDEASSGQRPRIFVDYTDNAAPTITSISTDSSAIAPKNIGEELTFTIAWSDLEADDASLYICNSSEVSIAGCTDTELCSASLSSSSPLQCSYTITSSNNRTNPFYASVCDTGNCSSSNLSYFYMNHPSTILLVSPNGGETINQSLGNYRIRFNVTDNDTDTLSASLYYGAIQNSTTNTIASSLSLSSYCTGSMNKNCSYLWDSTGIYGNFFLTIIVNDSFTTSTKSSASSFSVVSLIDDKAPNITSQSVETGAYSGKFIQFSADIAEPNINRVWVSINTTPQTNITMRNLTETNYNATWRAAAAKVYSFKVYASDLIGNLNDSQPWQEFNVSVPLASPQSTIYPSTVMPYNVIKITGNLTATQALREVYAYLNAPEGFSFMAEYPQNLYIGNFSDSQSRTAVWFLAAPISESTYSLNINYSDYYNNRWNSSFFNIQTTSSIGGGYSLSISGYPEVETTQNYFCQADFKSSGLNTAADSVKISLYDPVGNLIVGPIDMSNPSTGLYNHTYSVPAVSTEGQWETRVNATKSSISYYSTQFWKLVGGPFDVRSITIDNSDIAALTISVTTENTGGATKDLTLAWNLTATGTGALLDSGADTFAVTASSTRIWTINPTTDYVGQVKITFLGQYSQTERAGAYKIFSTTSGTTPVTPPADSGGGGGGGGGAGTTTQNVSTDKKAAALLTFDKTIEIAKNIEKTVYLTLENTGTSTLSEIVLSIEGLDPSLYTISPSSLSSLAPGKKATFSIKFLSSSNEGETEFLYKINSKELELSESAKLIQLSIRQYFASEIKSLKDRLDELERNKASEAKIAECRQLVNETETFANEESYISARDSLKKAKDCVDSIETPTTNIFAGMIGFLGQYWIWLLILAVLIAILIVLILIIRAVFKKLSLIGFMNTEKSLPEEKPVSKKKFIEDKLKDIEDRLEL